MKTLETAKREELQQYMEIIEDAKKFQQEQGFVQWTDDYPNIYTLAGDIEAARGYVLKFDGQVAGYMCIDFDGDPSYADIRGAWRWEPPYAVVHRMALSRNFRDKGLSAAAFQLIDKICLEKGVKNIRMDTDPFNQRMQHVLKKNGFEQCGIIVFQGSDKLAFDKLL